MMMVVVVGVRVLLLRLWPLMLLLMLLRCWPRHQRQHHRDGPSRASPPAPWRPMPRDTARSDRGSAVGEARERHPTPPAPSAADQPVAEAAGGVHVTPHSRPRRHRARARATARVAGAADDADAVAADTSARPTNARGAHALAHALAHAHARTHAPGRTSPRPTAGSEQSTRNGPTRVRRHHVGHARSNARKQRVP